jgi:hypothetical protein
VLQIKMPNVKVLGAFDLCTLELSLIVIPAYTF